MVKQARFEIRIEEEEKKAFFKKCKRLKLEAAEVIRRFIRHFIKTGKID